MKNYQGVMFDDYKKNRDLEYNVTFISAPYYKCNHAVGIANANKINGDIKKVTCKNCIKWYT